MGSLNARIAVQLKLLRLSMRIATTVISALHPTVLLLALFFIKLM